MCTSQIILSLFLTGFFLEAEKLPHLDRASEPPTASSASSAASTTASLTFWRQRSGEEGRKEGGIHTEKERRERNRKTGKAVLLPKERARDGERATFSRRPWRERKKKLGARGDKKARPKSAFFGEGGGFLTRTTTTAEVIKISCQRASPEEKVILAP